MENSKCVELFMYDMRTPATHGATLYIYWWGFFSNHRTLRIIVTMKDLRDHYTLPLAYIKIIYVSLKNLQKDTTTFYRNFLEITGILD